ncbi:MAG: MmcQ/YjbR family DNA-binding protein [Ruminococcus sp.]|nr:MmcQ/YjbR family DNA-binding protein [Ruminococcus sp.]
MRNLSKSLENKILDYDKLISYGFTKNNNSYLYETFIKDNNFKVIVEISPEKQTSKVIDLNTNDEYLSVDVKDITGDFVGKIKEEYETVLNDIIDKCTTPHIFKSKQAGDLIKHIKEKYHDDLEYLWEKFPNNAIWRNKKNNKWYGILMVLNESKLGLNSNQLIDILVLRYPKEKIDNIIDNKKIFKGYHMNKNHWITLKLDGSIDINDIYCFIANSYEISLAK